MKVLLLVHDLSTNSIARTYPIAKVLQRHHEVEVLGPVFGNGIYKPYADEFIYNHVNVRNSSLPFALPKLFKLAKKIDGDAIYAFKPMPASYGLGLLAKQSKGISLVLDIEDLDGCFPFRGAAKRIAYPLLSNYSIKGYAYIKLLQRLTGLADQTTVVSNFLQKKFGGVKLPHGANCNFFDPKKAKREEIRKRHGMQGKKIVLFTGSPTMHKGISDLAEAIKNLERKDVQLAVAGSKTGYLQALMKKYSNIRYLGCFPHSSMPELLSTSDLIVLPQRNLRYAQAQVPGKAFEAMAMEKPIIATAVSDTPEILEGCGWIVEPKNPQKLAESIKYVLDNPKEASEKGRKARKKCIERYSWDAMEKILDKVFKEI